MSKPTEIKHYNIGIDTGGTYTDAVIIDTVSQQIIATAKALTTRGNLSIGVIKALKSVIASAGDSLDQSKISSVCLSTTLATNALIEGHGAKIGVFLIGFDDAMVERSGIAQTIETATLFRIDGGHKYTGQERTPLALNKVEDALKNHQQISSYAVTSHYAIRNTEHEQRVKALIQEKTACPVTASWEISNALNDPLRALTAALNARMVPLISSLTEAIQNSLTQLNIKANIMIVKGDGSIGSAQSTVLKPIETILSGPAASVIGAKFLTGLSDFAVVDMGGTSSDIATIKNGWPQVVDRGASVGGFHTLIRAIDVKTIGLGGDTEISAERNAKLQLETHRVVPISCLAHQWPWIEKKLEQALVNKQGLWHANHYIILPEGASTALKDVNLTDKDQQFLAHLDSNQPKHYYDIIFSASDRSCLARLLKQGLVQISGVTPSDAAHVLGNQSQWSATAAALACEIIGQISGITRAAQTHQPAKDIAQNIMDLVVSKSSKLVIECLAGKEFDDDDALINAATSGTGSVGNLTICLKPKIDIVAVGGPAAIFYPHVAKRLNTNITIPKNSDVANAVGAAISLLKIRAIIEITYAEKGGYLIHHHGKPETIETGNNAIERARELAKQQVTQELELMGGTHLEFHISTKRIDLPGIEKDNSLMAATITAEVIGELSSHLR